ncbi:MAG: NAD(P)/FAD-dependent oxidoreductase [Terriglobia bacterium]
MKSVAIIGGGPAGATAAERLLSIRSARGGEAWCVTVFEENPGWEKPCGGGLTTKTIQRYPYLMDVTAPHFRVEEAEIVAASGDAVRFRLRAPLLIYSRRVLNHVLLQRAQSAGARVVQDHILSFAREGSAWRLEGRTGEYRADFLILASGARSGLRKLLAPPIRARDLLLTFGYFAPRTSTVLRVCFFKDFEGYAWAFPRPDHVSVGIAGRMGENDMPGLQRRLNDFIRRHGYTSQHAPVFAHILPALGPTRWREMPLSGDGWAILGDAGGLVDPLTGEGIYFAMRSAEILAQSLLSECPQAYAYHVWREFGSRHEMGARLAHRFYLTNFWGKPVTTRMVEFCSRSRAFMALLQDLFEGTQTYAGLPRRMYATLPKGMMEIAAEAVKKKLSAARP